MVKDKIIFLMFICSFIVPVYAINSKNTEALLVFANNKNVDYIDCLEGVFSDQLNTQVIGFFKKELNDYKVFYFLLDDNLIVDCVEISQFHHYFDTTAFDLQQLKKNNCNTNNSLGIVYDLTGDGYDELILDYGLEKIFPLVLKYMNHSFHQILKIDGFPISNVVLPGAPDVFETWRLIYFEKRCIVLKRLQSDLVQYVSFLWDSNYNYFVVPNSYDYFENTGFNSSNINDFKCLKTKLSSEYLETLSSKQLRLLRNAIYAKYGRNFSSWDLVDNFLQCKWYTANKEFSDSALNQLDKKNIQLIQIFEQKKGIYKPISWNLDFFDEARYF